MNGFNRTIFLLMVLLAGTRGEAQQTVGLFTYDEIQAFPGYNLLDPLQSGTVFLLDNCGRVVHDWTSNYQGGNSVYLMEDGSLYRAGRVTDNAVFSGGGQGGIVERFDWEGNRTWSYEYNSNQVLQHHDFEVLPNGNLLLIAWELKTGAEAVNAGRNPDSIINNELWPDHIVEITPIDSNDAIIVWEWHAWDHLIQDFDSTKSNFGVVADHPELIDVNYASRGGARDWMHINAIDYHTALDQIIVSVHSFDEVFILDHSTTTSEAASHTGGIYGKGGDILYRWGNPAAYQRGSAMDQRLYAQHDAHWIADSLTDGGKIMIFNNGKDRPQGNFSSVDIIAPPEDSTGFYQQSSLPFSPDSAQWSCNPQPPNDFYAPNVSGAQRLPNGNTLICNGSKGWILEVNPQKAVVWEYINPVTKNGIVAQGDPVPNFNAPGGAGNLVFRFQRFPEGYPAFNGRDLTPGPLLELDPFPDTCGGSVSVQEPVDDGQMIYPNPANRSMIIHAERPDRFVLLDVTGKEILKQVLVVGANFVDVSSIAPGIYYLRFANGDAKKVVKN